MGLSAVGTKLTSGPLSLSLSLPLACAHLCALSKILKHQMLGVYIYPCYISSCWGNIESGTCYVSMLNKNVDFVVYISNIYISVVLFKLLLGTK